MKLRVIRLVWIFLAVAPLVRALKWAEGEHHGEALEFLVGVLMAMGFPSTLPVLGLMFLSTLGLRQAGIEVAGTRLSFVAGWALLILTGYLQWFVAVPALVRWFRDPGPAGAGAGAQAGAGPGAAGADRGAR